MDRAAIQSVRDLACKSLFYLHIAASIAVYVAILYTQVPLGIATVKPLYFEAHLIRIPVLFEFISIS